MRRYVLTGLICLLAGGEPTLAANDDSPPASAPAAGTPIISMEEPMPGDFWTYEVRDEISGTVKAVRNNLVTEVTATEISVRFNIQGKPQNGFNVYDRSWNLKGSAPWKYTPHDGSGIQSPLKVGANWKSEADDINAGNGNIWKRSSRSKVLDQEAVTTKAGTFETFKIETTINRRPTSDPTRKVEITQQTWYAPSIDHWVKRTVVARGNGNLIANDTVELVEYGRRK
jgi:uncharacterized protein DUF3108